MQLQSALPCLFLLTSVAQAGNVYYNNSTIFWPSESASSYVLDQSANHYHNVTDNGYGMVNVKTFTQHTQFYGAKTQWTSSNSYQLIESNYYQFLMSVSFSISWESWMPQSGERISILVKYRDQSSKQLTIIFSHYSQITAGGLITVTETNTNTQSTRNFNIKAGSPSWNLQIFPQAINPLQLQSYNMEFDVIGLVKAVKAYYNTYDSFFVTFIHSRIETNKLRADIDLNVSKTISQTTCCEPSTIILKNIPINSQVFQNIIQPNYCKILFGGSELSSLQFAFNFQNTPYSLKSYQYVSFGYLHPRWVTPIDAYKLPLYLRNQSEIKVNFTYSYLEKVSSKTAVCFTIVLRDDYDTMSKEFDNNNADPSVEIIICPWWRTDELNGGKIKEMLFGDHLYRMYVTTASWPVFTFNSLANIQQSVQNLDLYDFVRQVLTFDSYISRHYLVSIQMGFRTYSGEGTFSVQQLALQVKYLPKIVPLIETTPPPYKKPTKSTECLIENLGAQSSNNQCHVGVVIYRAANQIMSTPNLALVVRMVCALRLIDDLTYYAYHKNNYDKRFRGLCLLAWNLTSSKWMIPQLKPFYESFEFTYQQDLSQDPTFLVPNSYVQLGEDANLLRQTQDFWLSSLPFTVVIFTLVHFLYLFLSRFEFTRKFSNIFIRFKWFGFLTISIIGDNIQYLSFRCFSQLYQLLPSTNTQIATIVTSHVSLFFVVFYSVGAYYILPVFISKHSMLVSGVNERLKTANYLSFVTLLRVCAGFVHSSLVRDCPTQILCLLLIQLTLLTLLLSSRPFYLCKTLFTCHLIQSLLRTTLQITLCLEIYQKPFVLNYPVFEQVTGTLVECIFIMCAVDLVVSNTVSGDVFDFYTMTIFNKLKKPKIELTDQTGRTEEIIAEPTNLVSHKLNYNVRLQVLEKRRDVNLKKKEKALHGILVKKGKFDTRDLLATNSVRISVCPSPVLGFKN